MISCCLRSAINPPPQKRVNSGLFSELTTTDFTLNALTSGEIIPIVELFFA